MSRHTVPTLSEDIELTVGWDPPLATFFAHVCRIDKANDDETMLLWLGGSPQEITRPTDLVAPLLPYATLSAGLLAQLAADRDAPDGDGPPARRRPMFGWLRRTQ